MDLARRSPALVLVALMVALVALVNANLSMLGIGAGALLYDSIGLPRLVVSVVMILVAWSMVSLRARRSGTGLRADVIVLMLIGLATWSALSAAVSSHRALALLGQSERLEGVVTMVLYVLAYGIGLQVTRHVRDARLMAASVAIAATALSVYGVAQFVGIDPASYVYEGYAFDTHRAFATFGNPNFFAGFLVLALPIAGSLAVSGPTRRIRVLWAASAIVIAVALFATFTRGAWLAVMIQGGVALWLWANGRRSADGSRRTLSHDARVIIGTAAVVLAVSIGISLSTTGETNVLTRLTSMFDHGGSVGERMATAGVVASAASQRPLTGYGPDTFLATFRLHRTDQYAASFGEAATVNNAHSWPLQYLATLGVPGATLLLAALAVALMRGRPRLPAGAGPEAIPNTVLMSGIWLGCLGLVVHLQFNVAVLGLSIPLWVLLAATGAPRAPQVRVGPKSLTAAGALFAVLALCAAIASTSLIAADRAYLESRQAYHETDWERAIARAETARRLNPLSVKYARGAAQARAGRVFSAIAQDTAPATVVELHAAAIKEFEYLDSTHPNDYAGWAWRAALQAQTGVYTGNDNLFRDAIESANRAATLDRQHAEVTAIANGDVSPEAVLRANNVLPLP